MLLTVQTAIIYLFGRYFDSKPGLLPQTITLFELHT
jgi:hypothetical protein